jgi:hypothetical protein
MNVLYTAEATAFGGREGHVRSTDGTLNLDLAIPKELGGPGGLATNPEQLFAAGLPRVSRTQSATLPGEERHSWGRPRSQRASA